MKEYGLTPRVIRDLKKRSATGVYFYFVVIAIVLFTDGYYVRHPEFSVGFIFLVTGICLFRIFHQFIVRWSGPGFEKIHNRIFLSSVALTGLIWGAGFARFMLQKSESNAQMLMVMCTIGICAGGVVAYIPALRLSIAFNFFMLVPAMVSMAVYRINMSLVIAIFLFFCYLSFMALRGNQEYWDALENEYLLEEKSRDLIKMSRLDSLTGLFNRRYFDDMFGFQWSRSVRNQTSISIVLCDIDHFKQINDQYGHPAGDQYLRELARMIQQVFKRKTDIAARYGGEEFIVLMPDESCENVCKLAEAIRLMIHNYCLEFEGHAIHTTISLGVATYVPGPDDKQELLISMADKALYHSKKGGRNKVTKSDGFVICSLQ